VTAINALNTVATLTAALTGRGLGDKDDNSCCKTVSFDLLILMVADGAAMLDVLGCTGKKLA